MKKRGSNERRLAEDSPALSGADIQEAILPAYKNLALDGLDRNRQISADVVSNTSILALEAELKDRRDRLGENDISVADTLNTIGLHYHHVTGEQDKALDNHRKALGVQKQVAASPAFIDNDDRRSELYTQIAITLTDIGNALKLKGACEEAMQSYSEAMTIFGDLGMTEDHPRVSAALRCIESINRQYEKKSCLPSYST